VILALLGEIILGGPVEQRGGVIDWRVDLAVMRVWIAAPDRDLGVGGKLGLRGLAAFGLGHDDKFLANFGIYSVCCGNRNPLTYRSDRSVMAR